MVACNFNFLAALAGCVLLSIADARCPPGYEAPYVSNCYKFVKSATTWQGAINSCRRDNAFLVSVETAGEQLHLARYINARSHLKHAGFNTVRYWGYWMSGSDVDHEGVWTWTSTGRAMTYKNFYRGEPNNWSGHENCVVLVASWGWKWNDWHCNTRTSYICEKTVSPICI